MHNGIRARTTSAIQGIWKRNGSPSRNQHLQRFGFSPWLRTSDHVRSTSVILIPGHLLFAWARLCNGPSGPLVDSGLCWLGRLPLTHLVRTGTSYPDHRQDMSSLTNGLAKTWEAQRHETRWPEARSLAQVPFAMRRAQGPRSMMGSLSKRLLWDLPYQERC